MHAGLCGIAGRLFISVLSLWFSRGDRIVRSTFENLHVRMTRADVIRMLGCLPGDYRTAPDPSIVDYYSTRWWGPWEIWQGDFGKLGMRFDKEGRLGAANYQSGEWSEGTPLATRLESAIRNCGHIGGAKS